MVILAQEPPGAPAQLKCLSSSSFKAFPGRAALPARVSSCRCSYRHGAGVWHRHSGDDVRSGPPVAAHTPCKTGGDGEPGQRPGPDGSRNAAATPTTISPGPTSGGSRPIGSASVSQPTAEHECAIIRRTKRCRRSRRQSRPRGPRLATGDLTSRTPARRCRQASCAGESRTLRLPSRLLKTMTGIVRSRVGVVPTESACAQ